MTKISGIPVRNRNVECPFPTQHDLSLLIVSSQLCIFRAVIIAQLSTASTFFTLLSWLPTFFKETFPDSKVGWLRSRGIAAQRRPCWGPAKRDWRERKMMERGLVRAGWEAGGGGRFPCGIRSRGTPAHTF